MRNSIIKNKKGLVMKKAIVIILVLIVVAVVMFWSGSSIARLTKGIVGFGAEPCPVGQITEECYCGKGDFNPDSDENKGVVRYCCEGKIKENPCDIIGIDTVNLKADPVTVSITDRPWLSSDTKLQGNTISIYLDKPIDGHSAKGHPAIDLYEDDRLWGTGWFRAGPDDESEWKKVSSSLTWYYPVSEDVEYKNRIEITGLKNNTYYLIHIHENVPLNSNGQKINPYRSWIAFKTR